jgi:hypothetical protein
MMLTFVHEKFMFLYKGLLGLFVPAAMMNINELGRNAKITAA